MNRSALVIKMLNYLKANDIVSREALASYLETNVRNIKEFKKELEIAGYEIETIKGRYGGYRLVESGLLPMIMLTTREIQVLNDASMFLKTLHFNQMQNFDSALMKIQNSIKDFTNGSNIHYLFQHPLSKSETHFEELILRAKQESFYISMEYRTLKEKCFEKRLIAPYEVICSEDGNYVLAYDASAHKQHYFKTFKISSLRMQKVEIVEKRFIRDEDFKLSDYIGQHSIIKDAYEVQLQITGDKAILLYEKDFGMFVDKQMIADNLYLTFTMENKEKIIEFVLSLGKDCIVLSPEEIKKEIVTILSISLNQYMV